MEATPEPSTTAPPPDREIMAWHHLGEAARHLAEAVVASGYEPDIVLAIARGGLLPGGAVSYALGVKNSCAMNVEFYTDVDQRLNVPLILPPAPELIDLGDARMLIVDDVADTGRTLEVVQDFCAGKVAEVRTAVLYEKSHSLVKCDYVWRRTDRWIDFPWSAEPPVAGGGGAVA
jgi:hypoxanthine phosphoribosyltransferase